LSELKGAPEGTAGRIADDEELLALLRTDQPRILAYEEKQAAMLKEQEQKTEELAATLDEMKETNKQWQDKYEALALKSQEQKARLKELEKPADDEVDGEKTAGLLGVSAIWWVLGGAVILLGAATWLFTFRKAELPPEDEPPPPENRSAKKEPQGAN
jgi:hypothetical protein